ncbi:hypothetical protein [Streptomyces sp. NPDC046685]|uniref:hypothetical protein n=1 Tax=Streptomyces sp. NPDC046685 TaxID=3157202 RepID=UPI0033E2EEED
MAEAPDTAAEIKRLGSMTRKDFAGAVVHHAMGGTDPRCPREVQEQALASPQLVARTVDALEGALRNVRELVPRKEGESKSNYQARVVAARSSLQAAMAPLQMVLDDWAHTEAKYLAGLDDDAFASRWTKFVLGAESSAGVPRRVQGLAFRSPTVADRTAAVCQLMQQEPARFLPAGETGESPRARDARIEAFRSSVTNEERFLQFATQYAIARQGRMPTAPNHRLQALRLLAAAHPEEMSELLRQVRGEGHEAKKEARREDRMARRGSTGAAR